MARPEKWFGLFQTVGFFSIAAHCQWQAWLRHHRVPIPKAFDLKGSPTDAPTRHTQATYPTSVLRAVPSGPSLPPKPSKWAISTAARSLPIACSAVPMRIARCVFCGDRGEPSGRIGSGERV